MRDKLKKERRFKKITSSTNILFVVLLEILFNTFLIGAIVFVFINYNANTLPLTNSGFAILIAISSVCFSWARNIERNNDKYREHDRLMDCAIDSIYSAILYLFSSGFKFLSIGLQNTEGFKNIYSGSGFKITFLILFGICLLLASVRFSFVIKEILLLTVIHEDKSWEIEIKEKELRHQLKNVNEDALTVDEKEVKKD